MFKAEIEILENGNIAKYCISSKGVSLTYAELLSLWQTDSGFRSFFTAIFAGSEFDAYRWETPPVTCKTIDRPFEFVLINTPGFYSRPSDSDTYKEYYTTDDTTCGVVTFRNLRKDATLVVPSPRANINAYGHLAAFIRHAPDSQVDALWKVIGSTVADRITNLPLWVSTAGGGVAWLHVRLDSRPKYYSFTPYKNV